MAIYNGPPRGGTRGGKDQFTWDQVKSDNDRTYYLGHSVKALTGRWQKGKDVYWYTREKDESGGVSSNEFNAIKAKEEELMLQALGLKPKSQPSGQGRPLEKHELAALLQKDADDQPSAGAGAGLFEEDRMKGLGYGRGAVMAEAAHEVLGAEGPSDGAGPGNTGLPPPPPGPPPRVQLSTKDLKMLHKAMKKQEKKEKKSKKSKKEKHKKKSKKSTRHKNSSSDGGSSDDDAPRGTAYTRHGGRHDSRSPVRGGDGGSGRHDSRSPVRGGGGGSGRHDSRSPVRGGGGGGGRHDSRSPVRGGDGGGGRRDSRSPVRGGGGGGRHDSRSPVRGGGGGGRRDSRSPVYRRHRSRSPVRQRYHSRSPMRGSGGGGRYEARNRSPPRHRHDSP